MQMDEHISMKKNSEVSNTLAEIVSVNNQVKIDYNINNRNTELNIVIEKDAIINTEKEYLIIENYHNE